jgi:hypothetical protein
MAERLKHFAFQRGRVAADNRDRERLAKLQRLIGTSQAKGLGDPDRWQKT